MYTQVFSNTKDFTCFMINKMQIKAVKHIYLSDIKNSDNVIKLPKCGHIGSFRLCWQRG